MLNWLKGKTLQAARSGGSKGVDSKLRGIPESAPVGVELRGVDLTTSNPLTVVELSVGGTCRTAIVSSRLATQNAIFLNWICPTH